MITDTCSKQEQFPNRGYCPQKYGMFKYFWLPHNVDFEAPSLEGFQNFQQKKKKKKKQQTYSIS